MSGDEWRYLYKDMLAYLPGKIVDAVKHIDLMIDILEGHIDDKEINWLKEIRSKIAEIAREVDAKLYEL